MLADSWMLGSAEAVQRFRKQHEAFCDGSEALRRSIHIAFSRPFTPTGADAMIYLLGSRCAEDFREVVLLAANGFGWGATAHLRGMYERAVTAAYLRLEPSAVQDFVSYEYVRRWKIASKIEETMGIASEDQKGMAELQANFEAVKARFLISQCEHSEQKRLNHTWSRLDFVSMAAKVGTLGRSIVACYYLPLAQAHATAASVALRFSPNGDQYMLDPATAEAEADRTCEYAHLVILGVLTLQHEHFAIRQLDEPLGKAYEHFITTWHPQHGVG